MYEKLLTRLTEFKKATDEIYCLLRTVDQELPSRKNELDNVNRLLVEARRQLEEEKVRAGTHTEEARKNVASIVANATKAREEANIQLTAANQLKYELEQKIRDNDALKTALERRHAQLDAEKAAFDDRAKKLAEALK